MAHQVKRFMSRENYMEAKESGKSVSSTRLSWEEAVGLRDRLRKEDPKHYYNIIYYCGVSAIDTGNN